MSEKTSWQAPIVIEADDAEALTQANELPKAQSDDIDQFDRQIATEVKASITPSAQHVKKVSKASQARSAISWFKYSAISLTSFVVALMAFELYHWAVLVLNSPVWYDDVLLAILILAILLMTVGVIREAVLLKRLQRRSQLNHRFEQFLNEQSYGHIEPLLVPLKQQLANTGVSLDVERLVEQHQLAELSDQELLEVIETRYLTQLDKQAEQVIAKASINMSALVALSPLASLDVLLVFWHSARMTRKLLEIYGAQLGVIARYKFVFKVLRNALLMGAAELLADAGGELIGSKLLGGLSTRVAQGAAIGLLTARLGIQVQSQIRPMPFVLNKPSLKKIRMKIIASLTKSEDSKPIDS
jgi:putative membrane protein